MPNAPKRGSATFEDLLRERDAGWAEAAYLQILTADIERVVRAEPFEQVEISLAELFGEEP